MGRRRDAFFAESMYVVDVRGWPADQVHPARPLTTRMEAPDGAGLRVWPAHPHDRTALPDPGPGAVPLLDVARFRMGHSGNRTLDAPKRSWSIELEDGDELTGMERLILKSMYNDPSQMREALAWWLFGQAGVPAPRHTYARFGINGTYLGLFSVIEHIERSFVRDRFGDENDSGNLFKVSCGDIGCGTLERRFGPNGEDDGGQYHGESGEDRTYRLQSYADRPDAESYDDLATFIRTVDGAGIPGGEGRFDTDAYAMSMKAVFAVEDCLRWAGVNILAGSWDNYFATPANYYLYNAGHPGRDVMSEPYFAFIPWDYDNSFGIDYFGTQWQYTDLLDWPSNTEAYRRFNHGTGRSRIPLVTNLLANTGFRRYYLDHLEHLLDTVFSPTAIDAMIGIDGVGGATGDGLWDRVAMSAYLESDSPLGWPFTGRQFVNDEVYRAGFLQHELRRASGLILGIHHYVRMRYDRAREDLGRLRLLDPAGSSGADFAVHGAQPQPAAPGA